MVTLRDRVRASVARLTRVRADVRTGRATVDALRVAERDAARLWAGWVWLHDR